MTREECQQKIEEAASHLTEALNEVTSQGYDVDIAFGQSATLGDVGTTMYLGEILISKTRESESGYVPSSSVMIECDSQRSALDRKMVFLSQKLEDLETERDGRENG